MTRGESTMICPWCNGFVTPGAWDGHLPACPYAGQEPDLDAAASLPPGELQAQVQAVAAATPPEGM